jgi:hypothetical protein
MRFQPAIRDGQQHVARHRREVLCGIRGVDRNAFFARREGAACSESRREKGASSGILVDDGRGAIQVAGNLKTSTSSKGHPVCVNACRATCVQPRFQSKTVACYLRP